MSAQARIIRSRYIDSVVLMRLAQRLLQEDGVEDAAAMMATEANKALLADGGFLEEPTSANPNDLIVAVKAASLDAATRALADVEKLLVAPAGADAVTSVRTLDEAVSLRPSANIAVISLPGEHAGAEARRALERGLHVFLFSSNVPVEQEIELKQLASSRGLLCMGPDCGTAIIAGKGLGFANAVRQGSIGVVGAAGTGIQAVTSLLDGFGTGISHAIGCGGRDLSEAVGGITAYHALDALLADDATQAVVVLSKPAAPSVAARLRERAALSPKPVIFGFLGDPDCPATLDEIARRAAEAIGLHPASTPAALSEDVIAELRSALRPAQRYIRGLYAGGTLAYEAQLVLRSAGLDTASNAPLPGGLALADPLASAQHTIIDLGAEEFTRGRPHPMIDARARCARLLEEAGDPEVAVVMLDVVLGYGAARDPAGDLAATIAEARRVAGDDGRELLVLAYVCGTDHDPQNLHAQTAALQRAGAIVLPTNAAMARTAASVVAHALALSPAGVS